jgi:hypothetical protein
MTTEMDLLRMDERQRLAWLLANRGTVLAVGATWTGMIVWELARGRVPLFLIVMVPVFALLRVGLYFYYSRSPGALEGGRAAGRVGRAVKIGAAVLLILAFLMPLYSLPASENRRVVLDGGRDYGYGWQLLVDEPAMALPLVLAFLWPVLILLLLRLLSGRTSAIVLHVLEPLAAAVSSVVILWIPQVIFEFQIVLVFPVLAPVRAEIGCYLAVVANGLYVVGWFSEFLRSRIVGAEAAGA